MVRVEPFRAFRPPANIAEEVAAPPYDVLNSDEARVLAEGKPKSFLRVNKPEVDLPREISQYDVQVYEKGASNLKEFIAQGTLVQDETPCFYIYAQKMGEHIQYGICCGVYVEDYATGLIKRHEKTQVKKENDRTRLTYVQNANVGPVFLMYRDEAAVDTIVQKVTMGEGGSGAPPPPDTQITCEDGVEHTVWVIRDPQTIWDLRKAFEKVPCTYIADGHHRSASAFRVGEMHMKEAIARGDTITGAEPFNHFMAVCFPESQLHIMEYNRVVKDLAGLNAQQFLERVAVCFDVKGVENHEGAKPQAKRQMGMCLQGQWYLLTAKEGTYDDVDPVNSLDVQVLYDNVLAPILRIGNARTDERIKYVGGIRGSGEIQRLVADESEPWQVGFVLYPVSGEEVMRIADADELMPPKATWFEPKLASGLITRVLDNC
mmetsp:Transcript_4848/g.7282  ORF Transcript_4848/g.7282 Transcript_4848/m.7282 type:complete len:432 (-) Transcript_4848:307-1602(-)|eukprot:CAMPEP_0113942822 /NCGR_PEP_ID=MMETSP1339-20121228/10235_1 /TAXON_ID=94617 /ORGANISM="Fibrocapsa japonica" /LENGTH=431 /DNA_ID=CAMNT_0000947455 /DNA_START=65 /DNA_END=1360 /DNA_ORIENTATION=+ /assembly_acc=CAM_ASM_000762